MSGIPAHMIHATMRVPLNHAAGKWAARTLTRPQIGSFFGAVYAPVYAVHGRPWHREGAPVGASKEVMMTHISTTTVAVGTQ
jgi:hypothetical protein